MQQPNPNSSPSPRPAPNAATSTPPAINAAHPPCASEQFCYFHHTTRRPKPAAGKFRHLDAHEPFELPVVEDRASALSVAAQILVPHRLQRPRRRSRRTPPLQPADTHCIPASRAEAGPSRHLHQTRRTNAARRTTRRRRNPRTHRSHHRALARPIHLHLARDSSRNRCSRRCTRANDHSHPPGHCSASRTGQSARPPQTPARRPQSPADSSGQSSS